MTKPPVSLSMVGHGDTPYVEESANYLEARGLDASKVGLITLMRWDSKAHDASGDNWLAKGWALRIRGIDGQWVDNSYLFRPCNIPTRKLYKIVGGKDVEWECPKFVQLSNVPILHHCGSFTQFAESSVITIHEKVTSAEVCYNALGVPSLAISGCAGWGKKGVLLPGIRSIVERMAKDATVAVHFDGDIVSNPLIIQSASRLSGAINRIRPDVKVKFVALPTLNHGLGWDDWAVGQGGLLTEAWLSALANEGVLVEDAIPLEWLVQQYGVSCQLLRNGGVILEQTVDNYTRLLRFPRWDVLHVDLDGSIYEKSPDGWAYWGSHKDLSTQFFVWLERSVCQGYGSKVNGSRVEKALGAWIQARTVSVLTEMLRTQPSVSLAEARVAAERLCTDGFNVLGPMPKDEQIETTLRMFRDIIRRWGNDLKVDSQWVWCIVGPTNCGKSTFFDHVFDGVRDIGYLHIVKSDFTSGRVVPIEEYRKSAGSHIKMLDDYNPSTSFARDQETFLYSETSLRVATFRDHYENVPTPHLLHCIYGLTTTDKSRQFIRSAKNTGERRFVIWEVAGTVEVDGVLRGNREVIRECGLTLLTWAAHYGDVTGVATEFSAKHTENSIQQSAGVEALASGRINWRQVEELMQRFSRPTTGDYRFVLRTQFIPGLALCSQSQARLSPAVTTDLYNLCEECGAENIGKARVTVDGNDVQKDTVHRVKNVDEFVAKLREAL